MKTVSEGHLMMSNRYDFDFKLCTPSKGWAQVDTSQDASYFGTWANPKKLEVVTYAEGDVTHKRASSPEAFVVELKGIKLWNDEMGHKFLGIDPMGNADIEARFQALGLGDLLH